MPDYEIVKWDESRLDQSIPYVNIAYKARKYAFVADYVRFMVLHEYGGLYFDTDIEVIRGFDELLGEPLFLGLQAPHSVGVGVIGAMKGHPFLRRVLDKLDAEGRRGVLSYQPLPDLVSELAQAKDAAAPTILPEDCFYPYNPYSPVTIRRKPLQSNLSERTFCVHHWEGSWLGDASLRTMLSMRCKSLMRRAHPSRWRLGTVQATRS